MLDYIIVGQGLAGSMLSWFLMKENKKVLVVDEYNASSASNIAAGLVNPITGRKFVKTWLADDLIPFAERTYRELENLFNEKFFDALPVVHLFDSIKSQNDWSVRCAMPGYDQYLKNDSIVHLDKQKVKNEFGGFEITGSSRLNTASFLSRYRRYLTEHNALLAEPFSFNELKEVSGIVHYKNHQAIKIIFADGANAINNPFFKFLPFRLAKGECLILRIWDFYTDKVIKAEAAIMPYYGQDLYYAGATHDWYFDDEKPSELGKNELLGNIRAMLKCGFEVVEHKAAIRPTVKNRRPFIGFHPQQPCIGIFNGMGTKGVSLAPWFAKTFVDHMVQGTELPAEVDIKQLVL